MNASKFLITATMLLTPQTAVMPTGGPSAETSLRALEYRNTHITGVVDHFRAHGVVLERRTRSEGHTPDWVAPLDGHPCVLIKTEFLVFSSREDMDRYLMKVSRASVKHPAIPMAMFVPSVEYDGPKCAEEESLDSKTLYKSVTEKYRRLFTSYGGPNEPAR